MSGKPAWPRCWIWYGLAGAKLDAATFKVARTKNADSGAVRSARVPNLKCQENSVAG
jgi:hypothetical protein